jgi:hypothetical protein
MILKISVVILMIFLKSVISILPYPYKNLRISLQFVPFSLNIRCESKGLCGGSGRVETIRVFYGFFNIDKSLVRKNIEIKCL